MERSENFYSFNPSRPGDVILRIVKIINRFAEIERSPRNFRNFFLTVAI